jgi:hypothetical protein
VNEENKKQTSGSVGGYQQTVVNKAHRAFYDHEEVRVRLSALLKADNAFNVHRLHSALVVAGLDDRLDRTRVLSYLTNSNKFREELKKEKR